MKHKSDGILFIRNMKVEKLSLPLLCFMDKQKTGNEDMDSQTERQARTHLGNDKTQYKQHVQKDVYFALSIIDVAPLHFGPDQPRTQMWILGHLLVRSLVHLHRSLVHSLTLLTPSLMGK